MKKCLLVAGLPLQEGGVQVDPVAGNINRHTENIMVMFQTFLFIY
jgi:hypothetical protein